MDKNIGIIADAKMLIDTSSHTTIFTTEEIKYISQNAGREYYFGKTIGAESDGKWIYNTIQVSIFSFIDDDGELAEHLVILSNGKPVFLAEGNNLDDYETKYFDDDDWQKDLAVMSFYTKD